MYITDYEDRYVPKKNMSSGQPSSAQGMPIGGAGSPSYAPGGTTAVPPYPTPQALAQIDQGVPSTAQEAFQANIGYTQDYLRRQIGKRILASFLIGTNTYQDRTGILKAVGTDYILLTEEGGSTLLADLYSIKFVRVFRS